MDEMDDVQYEEFEERMKNTTMRVRINTSLSVGHFYLFGHELVYFWLISGQV